MHNKSFTVDNSISVVGGRNIADEYFQLKDGCSVCRLRCFGRGTDRGRNIRVLRRLLEPFAGGAHRAVHQESKKEDLETVRADIAEEFDGIYDTVYKQALDSQLLQDLMADRQPLFPGRHGFWPTAPTS